jgi:hypothetical protein
MFRLGCNCALATGLNVVYKTIEVVMMNGIDTTSSITRIQACNQDPAS